MFAWAGWGVMRPWASGFTVWRYRTGDTLNEVMADGYFDPLQRLAGIEAEDWIIGFSALDRPLELVILQRAPRLVVEPLHDWFQKTCGPEPVP